MARCSTAAALPTARRGAVARGRARAASRRARVSGLSAGGSTGVGRRRAERGVPSLAPLRAVERYAGTRARGPAGPRHLDESELQGQRGSAHCACLDRDREEVASRRTVGSPSDSPRVELLAGLVGHRSERHLPVCARAADVQVLEESITSAESCPARTALDEVSAPAVSPSTIRSHSRNSASSRLRRATEHGLDRHLILVAAAIWSSARRRLEAPRAARAITTARRQGPRSPRPRRRAAAASRVGSRGLEKANV